MNVWKTGHDNRREWFRGSKVFQRSAGGKRYLWNSALVTAGFILSPLSWWNDLVVNVPLAYAFSIPFALLSEKLFIPAFVLGYWLSNLLGFVLMHKGVIGITARSPEKIHWRRHLIIALVYTAIIVLMVWVGWIPLPTEFIDK